jgi:tetratricopeptide (TPR) repeat protein
MRSRFIAILLLASTAAVADAAMVGPGVGNPELLLSQGNKAYNAKEFDKAHEAYLKATRANPALPGPYLALARSLLRSNHRALSCYTYRLFLKISPDTGDRQKAQAELELCEKQLAANPESVDPVAKFAALKGAVLQALDKGVVVGTPDSVKETLTALLAAEYSAPDLAEIANKARTLAEQQAATAFAAAAKPGAAAADLRAGAEAYHFAAEVGSEEGPAQSHALYLGGCADLLEGKYDTAIEAFRKANSISPLPEARFRHGVALWKKGDHTGAVKLLEKEMKGDPRTSLIALAQALSSSDHKAGAEALENFLFEERFKKQ